MNSQFEFAVYLGEKLARLLEDEYSEKQLTDLLSETDKLSQGEEWEGFPSFTHLAGTFELSVQEVAMLCLQCYLVQSGRSLISPPETALLCYSLGHEQTREVSFLLQDSASQTSPLKQALALVSGRNCPLPKGATLLDIRNTDTNIEVFPELLREITEFISVTALGDERSLVQLCGKQGSGRKHLATQAVHTAADAPLMLLDLKKHSEDDQNSVRDIVTATMLSGAFIAIDGYTQLSSDFIGSLSEFFSIMFIIAESDVRLPNGYRVLGRELPTPSVTSREKLIRAMGGSVMNDETIKHAATYRLTPGDISSAAMRLKAEHSIGTPTTHDQLLLFREQAAPELMKNAELLEGRLGFESLVLPKEQKQLIKDICAYTKARDQVYEQWGFGETIPYGKGISVLFYGASGTGKTLAATIMAKELVLPLYRVDLSQAISKYVGETQKNLGQIFDAAQDTDCIIFFDEADALFSRRTDAGDSMDRHSNAEIAYLLQRTEQHEGIIILATNLLSNFDEAFRRRISYIINFPAPDKNLRLKLWEQNIPPRAPCEDLELSLLADSLELTGAGIKNTVLNAAYMAAITESSISMPLLVQCAREEYQKQGKVFPHTLNQMFS